MRLTVAPVKAQDVVREVIDGVRLAADTKGVSLTELIEPDLPPIRGDAGRLEQVIGNLLANAIKFTPKDGHVTIALRSVNTSLRVEVHDTGDGIDPAFLPHVFERYRQESASTPSRGGLGLGLAIVRHLVELHGGRVSASSPGPRRGATFVVELPLVSNSQAATAKPRVRPHEQRGACTHGQAHQHANAQCRHSGATGSRFVSYASITR